MSRTRLLAGLICWLCASAQQPASPPKSPAQPETNGPPASRGGPPRARLEASAQRNENVIVHRIDNDAIRESNVRLGDRVTIASEAAVETSTFATEHGQAPG